MFVIYKRAIFSNSLTNFVCSNFTPYFQFAVVVIYCDVTSLFFVFVCKPLAMDEELHQYDSFPAWYAATASIVRVIYQNGQNVVEMKMQNTKVQTSYTTMLLANMPFERD